MQKVQNQRLSKDDRLKVSVNVNTSAEGLPPILNCGAELFLNKARAMIEPEPYGPAMVAAHVLAQDITIKGQMGCRQREPNVLIGQRHFSTGPSFAEKPLSNALDALDCEMKVRMNEGLLSTFRP
jgi:hypothetical protein